MPIVRRTDYVNNCMWSMPLFNDVFSSVSYVASTVKKFGM